MDGSDGSVTNHSPYTYMSSASLHRMWLWLHKMNYILSAYKYTWFTISSATLNLLVAATLQITAILEPVSVVFAMFAIPLVNGERPYDTILALLDGGLCEEVLQTRGLLDGEVFVPVRVCRRSSLVYMWMSKKLPRHTLCTLCQHSEWRCKYLSKDPHPWKAVGTIACVRCRCCWLHEQFQDRKGPSSQRWDTGTQIPALVLVVHHQSALICLTSHVFFLVWWVYFVDTIFCGSLSRKCQSQRSAPDLQVSGKVPEPLRIGDLNTNYY